MPNDNTQLPPEKLRPEEEVLCERLDFFYQFYNRKDKPSDYYKGALFVAREDNRESNTDWLAQAAHSFREILYPFFSPKAKNVPVKKIEAFKRYGSFGDKLIEEQQIGKFYGRLNEVAHHEINVDFEELRQEFVTIMNKALAYQFDIHRLIDEILKKKPELKEKSRFISEVRDLIAINPDARHYFYARADESWLDWLWDNRFLDVIKQRAEDPTRYKYKTPELNYLVRVADIAAAKVAKIIMSVPFSAENFNPKVMDGLLQICSGLPADQLALVVPKIHDEKWVQLMGAFNQWGFDYEEMFKTLDGAKDFQSVLILAEAVLVVRTGEEIEKSMQDSTGANPLYFKDSLYTIVFEQLANIPDEYVERAFELVAKAFGRVISLVKTEKSRELSPIKDAFYMSELLDVDFFNFCLNNKKSLSRKDNVRELAAVVTTLIRRLIEDKCDKASYVKSIYEKHILPLPTCRVVWRLQLFVMSLCPRVFIEELKNAFFKLFEVEDYYEIIDGAEYETALIRSFAELNETDKRKYVKQVLKYFGEIMKSDDEKKFHMVHGSRILSLIASQLMAEEKKTATKIGFKIDLGYKPRPSFGEVHGGFVIPRAPIAQEKFSKFAIEELVNKLKTEWTPEKLTAQDPGDDFLSPLNAEGVGNLIRNDVSERLRSYVSKAELFWDHDALDLHYTYSFLRGIQEAIKNKRSAAFGAEWGNLIKLFLRIVHSNRKHLNGQTRRERDLFGAGLIGWNAIYSTIADALQELLSEKDGLVLVDLKNHREKLFDILSHLLDYPDPTPADEDIKTAGRKEKSPGEDEYFVIDPYLMAINTVRGRSFKVLVSFTHQDSINISDRNASKISLDVKKLYEKVLKKEDTRAIMFMFGYYLSFFYFYDKEWVRKLLPKIFPQNPEKKYLYMAALEGYFANNPYKDLFLEPEIQSIYKRYLTSKKIEYPKQKYYRDPDESVAIHLALAYMHLDDFEFGHHLYDTFWKTKNVAQHANFLSFLGRSFVSGDNVKTNELLQHNPLCKQRLKDLWDWMLKEYDNPEPFVEFGYWINLKKDIFEPTWLASRIKKTLEITKGYLSYDNGLMESISILAKEAPEDSLEILRLYFLISSVREDSRKVIFNGVREWHEAFEILYDNPQTKFETYTLINNLINEGGKLYWYLKKVLGENN